jgi:hypothetical protein
MYHAEIATKFRTQKLGKFPKWHQQRGMKGRIEIEAKHKELNTNQAPIIQIPIIEYRIIKKLKIKRWKSRKCLY